MTSSPALSVVFRVDASFDIGTGHVMRCLTLADALRERGARCTFICREHPGHLIEHIRRKGYAVHVLPQATDDLCQTAEAGISPPPMHASWLGCDWQTDARQTQAVLAEEKAHWLIVDHYALDRRWEIALQGYYEKLMVIDDLADRPHACDLLLDQNLGRKPDDYDNLVPAHCRRLIGPQYALLRPEFAQWRPYSLQRRRNPKLKRLLITMGGVDQPNATCQVLGALKSCPLPFDCQITIVMGTRAPWLEQVQAFTVTMPWPTELLVDVNDMAELMAESDLAIGAAGTTSWERCCLGLPTLLVVLAENQAAGAWALHQIGAARLLGEPEAIPKEFPRAFYELLKDQALIDMSLAARAVTDGQGASRIIHVMGYLNEAYVCHP